MAYAGKAAGLGDCRRIGEHTSVALCGNWARTGPPQSFDLRRPEKIDGGTLTVESVTHRL